MLLTFLNLFYLRGLEGVSYYMNILWLEARFRESVPLLNIILKIWTKLKFCVEIIKHFNNFIRGVNKMYKV